MADDEELRFTPSEYEAYEALPKWKLDNAEWTDEKEYHEYWAKTILNWQKQYKEEYGAVQSQWTKAAEYIDKLPDKSFDIFVPDIDIASARLPFALCGLLQQVSMLYSNYPQPQYIAPSMDFDQYVAALNATKNIELKQNSFNALMFDVGIDVGYASFGCLKTYVDTDSEGPYGKEGKIVIQKMDPMKVAFDPKAKRLKWEDLAFIMVEDDYDLGTARRMFKGGAHLIDEGMTDRQGANNDGLFGHNMVSPVPNPIEGNAALRDQVQIIECWFKDDRLKFVADLELVDNPEFLDEELLGLPIPNPDYDPDKPSSYTRAKIDDDGYVVGEWIPAYPDGRCIVLAAGKTAILDFANPYWHKRAPFTFFRGRPSRRLVTTGDLTDLVTIDMKKNDILSRVHIMCQNEIERPMVAETQTFRTPRAWMRMSGQSTSVIVKNPGREFMRLPPTEIPQFPWVYLQQLDRAMDMAMAVAGVMRGDLTEGSQLSAEAVSSLQGMATSMLKMKAELIAEGIKDLGYQLMYLQRQTYDMNIQIPVVTPDGEKMTVNWNDKEAASNYIVDIQSGTGLPGADSAQQAAAVPLFAQGLIDRQAALQDLRRPDWKEITSRMDKKKLDEETAQAAGRAMGLQIKGIQKEDGKAGRRMKG